MHRYPSGAVPSTLIDARIRWATAAVGPMPVIISEAAYNNGMQTNAYAPVPSDLIGVYADRLLMEHVSRGNDMYWFELLNNYPPTSTNQEHFWGLVSVPEAEPTSWQPLPAYRTFRRFLSLMEDGDAPYSPPALPISLGGASDVKSYLVGKRDGSYMLALWRDVSIWDRTTSTRLDPPAASVTVTFDVPKQVTVYKPSIRKSPYRTAREISHSVNVSGTLMLLHIVS